MEGEKEVEKVDSTKNYNFNSFTESKFFEVEGVRTRFDSGV